MSLASPSSSAGAGVALAAGAAATAVSGLAGLGHRLKVGLHLRRHAEDDGGLHGDALLLQVRVHLAASQQRKINQSKSTDYVSYILLMMKTK
jgi:hypothetical protein